MLHRFLLSTALTFVAGMAAAQDCDVAIVNGRVMDPETNFDAVRNVCIKGDRIVSITADALRGTKEIDANGHVVAPGFINTHSHSFGPFDQKMMAHDGTTTILDTESGVADAELFYDKYEGKSFLNYGVGMGHEEIRRVVMDWVPIELASDPTYILASRGAAEKEDGHASWALDVPSKGQLAEVMTMYEKGLRAGAITVNTTVGYMGYNTFPKEIFALQKLAKKYDRYFGAHTRFGPTESLPLYYSLGANEVIANAVALDGSLIVSHIQNQGWEEIYELVRRLQGRGMNIFAEYYPAVTGNPNIATPQLLPDKIEGNNIKVTRDIFDTATGELYESEDEFFRQQKEDPSKPIFIKVRPDQDLKRWFHMKDIAIANDIVGYLVDGEPLPFDADFSEYGGHPRNSGSYGIVFREAREQGIPLMEIVNNASYIPAKYFSRVGLKPMQERGRMQEGMIADITIFNPDTITETSSMKKGMNGSFTKGIPFVLVSGQVIIDGGVAVPDLKPGQQIRYPVITDGEIDLDLGDKPFTWHADIDTPDDEHSEFPDRPAALENSIPGAPEQ
ncbi:hypothetical protein [uncultured Shimia sp.]|uniref:hypothetical protein n=1 Tax=uncultured Shimia sp. TaxID=573152 RepID=UPI00261648FB|nr:hypothetical protein [uncultured Shimia sp.]